MTAAPVSDLARVREPLRVGGMTLPHRIVMGSMHTGLDVKDDHGQALTAFYAERVAGGAGLIVTGGIAVNDAGRAGPDYAVFTNPADVARWERAVAGVHAGDGLIAAQLFHAGRYADPRTLAAPGEEPVPAVAPSAVPWRGAGDILPRALSDREVRETITAFADAAAAAVRSGFDAVEVMASEGYLINQFCSPRTNLRADGWGGSDIRRRRFGIAVVRAVRAAVPEGFPVLVRVSGDDLMPDSTTPEQAAAFAVDLVHAGADAISVGVGWHESRVPTVQTAVPSGAWLGTAERVARALQDAGHRVPVIVANKFIALDEAERALDRGTVDAVAMARPFLADPAIVAKSFGGQAELVNPCISCDQACIDQSLFSRPVSCLVNPRAGREAEFPLQTTWTPALRLGPAARAGGPDGGAAATAGSLSEERSDETNGRSLSEERSDETKGGTLAVIGSGPAGISAALDAARRGVHVVLFERADVVGGQFRLAARIPGKQTYGAAMDAAVRELRHLGADVRLRGEVTVDDAGRVPALDALDGLVGVVLATGVHPRRIALDSPAREAHAAADAGDPGPDVITRALDASDRVPGRFRPHLRHRLALLEELPHVLPYDQALRGPKPEGPVAVIGGGGIGVDVATWLTESESPRTRAARFFERFRLTGLSDAQAAVAGDTAGTAPSADDDVPVPGDDVWLFGRNKRLATGVGPTSRWVVLSTLRERGVHLHTSTEAVGLAPGGIRVHDADRERVVPVRTVIVCAGQVSHDPLSAALAASGIPFQTVGGAVDPSGLDAVRAFLHGLRAARALCPDPVG